MSTTIKVENLSKQYRLGKVGTGTISHDLNRWWHRVRGKEDPYLKIGEANDRSKKGDSEYVWALRDINFEIQQGDAVGIIGSNGAGKSTLLKILSRTTGPTTGQVKMKGRVASLLEVGTGFHPELTGRENIFLNGAILGMTKHEIQRKFDEIVDFSGVERYIDTPVKRYSSGMYVRLAFAVAAHLESEILVIDEVLAVGDYEFQSKCLRKMNEVSKSEGRTILFVSHNLESILSLTKNSILIDKGKVVSYGNSSDTVNAYQQYSIKEVAVTSIYNSLNWVDLREAHCSRELIITQIERLNNSHVISKDESLKIIVTVQNNTSKSFKDVSIAVNQKHLSDEPVFTSFTEPILTFEPNEIKNIELEIGSDSLLPGSYKNSIWISQGGLMKYKKDFHSVHNVVAIELFSSNSYRWFKNIWGNINYSGQVKMRF